MGRRGREGREGREEGEKGEKEICAVLDSFSRIDCIFIWSRPVPGGCSEKAGPTIRTPCRQAFSAPGTVAGAGSCDGDRPAWKLFSAGFSLPSSALLWMILPSLPS